MDRGAWQATVHGIKEELDMTEQTHTHTHSVLQLKTNFSVLLKQYSSKYFTQSPVYCKDFPPRLLGTKIITSVL